VIFDHARRSASRERSCPSKEKSSVLVVVARPFVHPVPSRIAARPSAGVRLSRRREPT
jgi:hypothetical protein